MLCHAVNFYQNWAEDCDENFEDFQKSTSYATLTSHLDAYKSQEDCEVTTVLGNFIFESLPDIINTDISSLPVYINDDKMMSPPHGDLFPATLDDFFIQAEQISVLQPIEQVQKVIVLSNAPQAIEFSNLIFPEFEESSCMFSSQSMTPSDEVVFDSVINDQYETEIIVDYEECSQVESLQVLEESIIVDDNESFEFQSIISSASNDSGCETASNISEKANLSKSIVEAENSESEFSFPKKSKRGRPRKRPEDHIKTLEELKKKGRKFTPKEEKKFRNLAACIKYRHSKADRYEVEYKKHEKLLKKSAILKAQIEKCRIILGVK